MLEEEEKEQNWFTRWDKDLPNPEDLIPLSQSLITPDLALAFHIQSPNPNLSAALHTQSTPANFDSSPVDGVSAADEPSRMSKRPRLVWTPQLHKRFVDAVAQLGIKNAVPKTIMQLMSVDGLTRENVASHLQKYRLYLKRMQGMQGLSSSAGAAEQLFASTPIENPFLACGGAGTGSGQDKFMQFMAPALIQNQQHMAQQQFYRQREMGHFGGYDDGFQRRMMGCSGLGLGISSPSAAVPNSCGEDFDSGSGGRRILTLFPTSSED